VVKHVLLGVLFRGMQRKEKGFLFLDTHAGRGVYDLLDAEWGRSLPRKAEFPHGYERIADAASRVPVSVEIYRDAVRRFDKLRGNLGGTLRFYPGSPWLARLWMRPQDRLVLCELNPSEYDVLAAELQTAERVAVQRRDGYGAVRAFLPPEEKRALVLIDPPFESTSEWSSLVACVAEAIARMPSATIAVWYPITERARNEHFLQEIQRLQPPAAWMAEVIVAGPQNELKMRGCGVLVLNPPWKADEEVTTAIQWLAEILARDTGARGGLSWLVPES